MLLCNKNKGDTMKNVVVVPSEKGKFKVLVNFIKRGVDYSTEALAEAQANKIRQATC